MKDYYQILGIAPDASHEEVASAYRQRAKDLHPDYHGADCGPFLDLQEAYEVLRDVARRAEYDRRRRPAMRQSRRPGPAANRRPEPLIPEDPWDRFDEEFDSPAQSLFDWLMGGRPTPRRRAGRDLRVKAHITPAEAHRGGRLRLAVSTEHRCEACQGAGHLGRILCPHCRGAGFVNTSELIDIEYGAGVADGQVLSIPLSRLGIAGGVLYVVFRVD